ncbi:hypothetical protein KPH14_010120 [Odynerus spinipes]|uniref:Uncharacterized protein n=1 Tax=Odynerus spinipes TaxID=1348599 RepID=A0AAD9RT50_9HYME|nr:hypothetical protein KPH14_010120 [Odynerus spinipes]
MEKACRLCLQKEESMLPIFSYNEGKLRLQIINCCSIQISEDDVLPKLMCIGCVKKLEAFYDFRQQCKKSDYILREHYKGTFDVEFNLNKDRIYQDVHVETDVKNESLEIRKTLSKQAKKILKQDDFNMHLNTNDDYSQNDDVMNNSKHSDYTISNIKDNQNSLEISDKMQVKDKCKASITVSRLGVRKSDRLKSRQDYICNYCEKECASKKALLEHTKFHVDGDGTKHKRSRTFKCEICKMPFKEKLKLNLHLRIHVKGLPIKTKQQYLCDVCSKTFASKSGLRLHLKSHNGSKPYACKFCSKSFVTLSYKTRHERTHTGDKHFVCHICSAAYASSNGFKYHLRIHTGEANYHCEICGKSFRRQKYLKEHTFTHTGERPFVCKICGTAYGNSGSLFVHEKKCKSRHTRDTTVFVKEEHE